MPVIPIPRLNLFVLVISLSFLGGCSTGPQPQAKIEEMAATSSRATNLADWIEFHNTTYGYTLQHPSNCQPIKMESSADEITEAGDINFCGLTINPEPADNFQEQSPKIAEKMRLPLAEFAKLTWEQNKFDENPNMKNKQVGALQQTVVSSSTAYTFNFDSSFQDVRGGYLVNSKSTAIIFSNGKMNFIAVYEANDDTAKSILRTLKFD